MAPRCWESSAKRTALFSNSAREIGPRELSRRTDAVGPAARADARGRRRQIDDRDKMKPGPKFYEWERRGVPIRLECGAHPPCCPLLLLPLPY
jgi:prolyl-tRNA synthetase